MPPVPPACQPIADSVAALDAQEQQLRAGLASLVGAPAWSALAQLGRVRQQLTDGRVALAECVRQNSAALQATLAVIDVDPGAAVPARIAGLWELTPPGGGGAIQREVSTVSGDSFAFTGPLPTAFGLTVTTVAAPTVFGPDFRSAALSAASLPTDGPLRVEVVVGPTVRLEQSDLARVAAAFTPTTSPLLGGSGPLATNAKLDVRQIDATLSDSGIVARAFGQVAIRALGIAESGIFEANATVRAVPTNLPAVADLVDVVTVSDLQVQFPAFASGMGDTVLPLVRGYLADLLTDQLRDVLRAELPAAVLRALVLPALPPDVVISVRKLSIDASALEFQPALGAIGTTLSTFAPPPIPPP
jgi:hypothetical protein